MDKVEQYAQAAGASAYQAKVAAQSRNDEVGEKLGDALQYIANAIIEMNRK